MATIGADLAAPRASFEDGEAIEVIGVRAYARGGDVEAGGGGGAFSDVGVGTGEPAPSRGYPRAP